MTRKYRNCESLNVGSAQSASCHFFCNLTSRTRKFACLQRLLLSTPPPLAGVWLLRQKDTATATLRIAVRGLSLSYPSLLQGVVCRTSVILLTSSAYSAC